MNRILKNIVYHLPWLLADRKYLELYFQLHMGCRPDLDHPRTFNEKIQWLKLHDRKPAYTAMADKAQAKRWAASIIGEDHIIPTIGVYDRVKDIPWDSLPAQFVIKCTHDSGGMVICRDRSSLDRREAERRLSRALRTRFWLRQREWAYKDIKPRLICEPLMRDESQSSSLNDYKFFCFNGKAGFMYISSGMDDHRSARMGFASPEGQPLPFRRTDYKCFEGSLPLPSDLPKMRSMAEQLAAASGACFVRVDMYEIGGQTYFSEMTFYPNGGLIPFEPSEWDMTAGKMIKLPDTRK